MLSRIVIALAMLFAASPATASQSQTCQTKGILSELDRKNPERLAHILREAANVKNSEGMLWRIERPGTGPSYLFGTLHIADRSIAALSPTTVAALQSSSVVALEAVETSRKSMSYIMAQAGKLMSARDRPLQRHLDEDELKVVERTLAAAGYPADLALGIRPWVATMFLTGSPCPSAEEAKPLDLLVVEEARRAGTRIVGLETLLEQFASIADIDEAAQVNWLKASIATHDRAADIGHTMAELYRFRRINAVWQLTRELAPTANLTDRDLAAIRFGLVAKRNARLIERSLPLIEAGGAFIAVGALHLSSEDGLVEDLRRRGFTLHRIE